MADPSTVQFVAPMDFATPHGCAGYVPLHGPVLHGFVSTSIGHGTPPYDACLTMLRVRNWVPALHGLVHVENALKPDTVQSTAHLLVLHCRVSSKAGQCVPLCAACVTTLRDRLCPPVPHDLVQALQVVHADTWQSTGHAWWLQTRVSTLCGQTTPP